MGSCAGSKQKRNSTGEGNEVHSLNTLEKNKLKQLVFTNKADSAPRLKLESNSLYAKRRLHGEIND
jgi:hypothetical protein